MSLRRHIKKSTSFRSSGTKSKPQPAFVSPDAAKKDFAPDLSKALYRSITELPLSVFIDCMCDQNYSGLVKDWTYVSEKDVLQAWEQIYDEYCDALKDREQRHLEVLTKEYNVLINKRDIINGCLYRLTINHSDEIVATLKQWTMVLEKFDKTDKAQYEKDLQAVRNRTARLDVDIRHLEADLKARLPQGIEKKNTKLDYERILLQLSRHMGSKPISKTEITVAQYVLMLVDMIMKAEAAERDMRKQ